MIAEGRWRRLGVLVRHLPRHSATSQAINGPAVAEWGQTEELLASVVDVLVAVNSRKGARSWTYPRPGTERDEGVKTVRSKRRHNLTSDELRARLAAKWAQGDLEVTSSL